jgi:hypothetical protein
MIKLMSKSNKTSQNRGNILENAAYFRLKKDLEDLKNYKLTTNQFLTNVSDIYFDRDNSNYIIDLVLVKPEESRIDEYQVI